MADGSLRMVRAPTLELDACQLGPDSGVLARIHAICAAAPTRTIRVNPVPPTPHSAKSKDPTLLLTSKTIVSLFLSVPTNLRQLHEATSLVPMATPSWDVPEVPVGTTSVVCFNYTLDGTLCEVRACSPASTPAGTTLSVAASSPRAAKPLRGTTGHVARDPAAVCGASGTGRPPGSEARPELLRSADDAQRGGAAGGDAGGAAGASGRRGESERALGVSDDKDVTVSSCSAGTCEARAGAYLLPGRR